MGGAERAGVNGMPSWRPVVNRICLGFREQDLPGIRTRESDANVLITLALVDEAVRRLSPTQRGALETELGTRCRKRTWCCDVIVAGC